MAIKVRARGGGGWVGGCFTVLFGLPFFGLGMTFFVMGIGSLFNPDLIEGDTMAKVMAAVIGGIFALVGGAVIWSGIRGIRGGRTSRPAGEVLAAGTGPNDWPMFPKARTCGRGPAGGELLKAHVTRVAALVGLTIASVLWNGISWLAMWAVLFNDKSAPLFVKIMIGLFCVIGLVLVGAVIRQILIMMTWAGTQVEVGKELLRPGESTRLRVYQRGDFAIDRLKLVVVAKETARYKVGTDTRVATEEIWRKVLVDQGSLRAQSGRPLVEAMLEIPSEAMHSFDARSNKFEWRIRMDVDAPGRVDINEEYTFRVAPEAAR